MSTSASAPRGIMIGGGVIEIVLGINAEGKALEDITKPLTSGSNAVEAEAPSERPLPEPLG